MNYPVWELTTFGGGFLIALIAVVHVFVAHFAVGGGAFLVLLESKAYRENDQGLLTYVKKHSKFFLLLTMVFGGMTGVGIWWIISLVSPGATSALIHIFVFGWAAEWVFFLAEIIALFIYFYTFGKMDRKNHLLVGWLYFFCAFMSLFLINGIIGFMLTPGAWLENQNFWSGFFNPSFWPALVFRTGLALVMCGVFGFVTGVWLKDDVLRRKVMRTCALWVMAPFVLMVAGGWWYIQALPAAPRSMIFEKSPELATYVATLSWFMPLLFVAALVMTLRLPRGLQKVGAVAVMVIAFVYLGSFEFVREGGRRPFVLYQQMYSNQIALADVPRIEEAGFLATARWAQHRQLGTDNELAGGRELFILQCSACHAVDGPLNDIKPLIRHYDSVFGMDAKLAGLGAASAYMPPFLGSLEERWALARYLVAEINGLKVAGQRGDLNMGNPVFARPELEVSVPAKNEMYVLLAWSQLGMGEIVDDNPFFRLQPPGNDLVAQLVRRGDSPQRITSGVTLSYQLDQSVAGVPGAAVTGELKVDRDAGAYFAKALPAPPYQNDGSYLPYLTYTVTARDTASGVVLATTRVVAPVATEMGCKNCHGGGWRVDDITGLSDETAAQILEVHDRISGTTLLAAAETGEITDCKSCHGDSATDSPGDPRQLSFSAAMHGWHALFLADSVEQQACVACHGARPQGPTHFYREHHGAFMNCSNCHGTMTRHALALLHQEDQAGKDGAAPLIAQLESRAVADSVTINGRRAWEQQPDCLTCHEDFAMGTSVDAFNVWTSGVDELFRNRHDLMGVMMCQACHGSTHALYPAQNSYGGQRDILQPLQYQGNDRPIGNDCTVCHTVAPTFEGHHPNSLRL